MKATIITIALVIVILLTVPLGVSPFVLAVSPETPAQTPKVYPEQLIGQSVASAESEASTSIGNDSEAPEAYSANDPYLSKQWALGEIPVFGVTAESTEVLIAVLDTGIDGRHEDLARKVAASINFTETQTSDDVHGHGTHVAGIIAATANNGLGIAGIAPNARLLNVKVADDNGMVWAHAAAEGIVWAVDNGAKVINMGFFVPASSPALEQAIDYAWSRGVVLVAAAGNGIESVPIYPACYPEVIAVAATDVSGNLWSKSNYGDWVDAYAPGVEIYSTLPGNNYGYQSGTSMAAAYVSAVAALALTTVTDTDGDGFVNDEVTSLLRSILAMPR
jgi:thermitase